MTVPILTHSQEIHHHSCGVCGRTLDTPGCLIPVLNAWVDPACYERYAGITPALLQRSGLGVFLGGPVRFELIRHRQAPGRWWWPERANELARKAVSLGLRFESTVDAITGVGIITLVMGPTRTDRERLRKAFIQLEEGEPNE